jgi:hypothetical protein
MKRYRKYVIENPQPEELAFHGKGLETLYKVLLSNKLIPNVNYYVTIAEIDKIPQCNPTCEIHTHDVDQIAIYIGKPGTFEVTYALVPPGKETIDKFKAHKEDEYTIKSTGCFFIPKGLRHNVRFDRVDEPIIEVSLLMKGSYP